MAAGCWLLAVGCWLMVDACGAVLESALNKDCKNTGCVPGHPVVTLGGSLGVLGRPWEVPRCPWVVPGVFGAPQRAPGASGGRPQGCPISRFESKTRAVVTIPGARKMLKVTNQPAGGPATDQQRVYHTGPGPSLSSQMKLRFMKTSDRRLRARDLTRPWPSGPANFLCHSC